MPLSPEEKRARRLAAQEKSPSLSAETMVDGIVDALRPSDRNPESGLTDAEFRKSRKEDRKQKPRTATEATARRVELYKAGKFPLLEEDMGGFLDSIADALRTHGGDTRDKGFRKEAMRIAADLMKRSDRGEDESSPIKENWDYWVESVEKEYEHRDRNGTPEQIAAMDALAVEHTRRVLAREAPTQAEG